MTNVSKAWAWLSSNQGLCTTAGAIGLAATTNANILHWGGWGTTNAPVIAGMGLCIFAGARAIGSGQKGLGLLGVMLIGAMMAGESYNFIATGESTIAERDEEATPIRDQAAKYEAATRRVADLESGKAESARVTLARETLAGLESNSETLRIKTARADVTMARAAYETRYRELKGDCRGTCQIKKQTLAAAERELAAALSAQRADSTTARNQALAELQTALSTAESDRKAALEAARQELKATKKPGNDAPLAHHLGWDAWALDLLAAFLRSYGANGLAAILITLGARRQPDESGIASEKSAGPVLAQADNDPGPTNGGPGPGLPQANPGNEATKSGKRGRRPSADVLQFTAAFRTKHGRTPTGPEIKAHFPEMGRTTAYDYASRVRATR